MSSQLPLSSDFCFGVAVFNELMKYFQQAAYRRQHSHEKRIKDLQTKKQKTIYKLELTLRINPQKFQEICFGGAMPWWHPMAASCHVAEA